MIVVSVTAPLGGCRHRKSDMINIELATAIAIAISVTGKKCSTVTPTHAAMTLPPNTGHGCASGLAGTTKTNTAEAPMGAIKKGKAGRKS